MLTLKKKGSFMNTFLDFGLNKSQLARLAGLSATTIRNYIEELEVYPTGGSKKIPKYSLVDCRKILKKAIASKFPIEKKVHTFFNFKGGVGKTTFAYQVSSTLALFGYNVLVIDTDPQYNLSTAFGVYFEGETGNPISDDKMSNIKTLYDVITYKYPVESAVIPVFDGLSLIPSNLNLTRLDQELFTTTRREEQFNEIIKPLRSKYDFIIMDVNPSISNTNLNAINASDVINVVAELQVFSLSSTNMLLTELDDFFTEKMRKSVPTLNIVPNKYNPKDVSSLKATSALKETYGNYIRDGFHVRQSSDFNRSSAEMIPLVFASNKNSNALHDTLELVDEILFLSSSNKERSILKDEVA
jgi:chromosome partitioning protein